MVSLELADYVFLIIFGVMNVVSVIPVKGRLPLLKHTIKRLLKKNGVSDVICVGETVEEANTVIDAGGRFLNHENTPLGKKWNAGFQYAKKFNPDVVLFVGSSDWISDNWLPELLPLMNKFDLVGKRDFTMMDIDAPRSKSHYRMCHWDGYGPGEREKEPIGIGRLVSARILNKIEWRPFDDHKNNSMDWMMYNKVIHNQGKIGLVTCDDLVSLSISTNEWPNMHKFEDHWNDKVPAKSHRIEKMERYFKMFPEYRQIFDREKNI